MGDSMRFILGILAFLSFSTATFAMDGDVEDLGRVIN